MAKGSVLIDSRVGDVNFPGLVPATSTTPNTFDGPVGSVTPSVLTGTTVTGAAVVATATLDSPLLGSVTPPNATFSAIHLDTGTKTAAATTGAATLNKMSGVITSEALSTAAGATYTLTLTNSNVAAADIVFADVYLGTATTGMPSVTTVTPGAGSAVIIVQNLHASAPINGTIKIPFFILKN